MPADQTMLPRVPGGTNQQPSTCCHKGSRTSLPPQRAAAVARHWFAARACHPCTAVQHSTAEAFGHHNSGRRQPRVFSAAGEQSDQWPTPARLTLGGRPPSAATLTRRGAAPPAAAAAAAWRQEHAAFCRSCMSVLRARHIKTRQARACDRVEQGGAHRSAAPASRHAPRPPAGRLAVRPALPARIPDA